MKCKASETEGFREHTLVCDRAGVSKATLQFAIYEAAR